MKETFVEISTNLEALFHLDFLFYQIPCSLLIRFSSKGLSIQNACEICIRNETVYSLSETNGGFFKR